ncbi:chymotrypsin-elastase inhibitor ixodidin-like [Chrysoperla carnea]|uniref:chymotrypsin-elastase inhibitor ixodidin-like n=1 Tax=Chrysoperla carnea TaxID=189513 RepID=UPI001D07252F|nr:chymotrypsin-elastase inhibitor ixodidin-like [Chrysoperla carnea]
MNTKLILLFTIVIINCVVNSNGQKTCSGANQVWNDCGTACPETCSNYDQDVICTEQCIVGCACKEGTVLNDQKNCVPISQCP